MSTGKISGDSSAAATIVRPGNSCRTTAKAAGIPNSSAPAVAPSARAVLKPSDVWNSGSARTRAYQFSVNPRGGKVTNGDVLTEIATVTRSGARMKIIVAVQISA